MLSAEKIGCILVTELMLIIVSNSAVLGGPVFDKHFNASAELYKKHEFRKAIKELNIAIQAEPNNFEGYYKRAKCYSETDSPQEGMPDFAKAIKLNPNFADIWVSRALAYQRLNDPTHAIEDLKRAVAIDPHHSKAFYKLLLLCFRQKDFKTGIKYSTIAIKNDVDLLDSLQMRGRLYALANDRRKMNADFDSALEKAQSQLSTLEKELPAPEKKIAKQKKVIADIFCERGKAFVILRDFNAALNDFENALTIIPQDTTYMCNVGGALLHMQRNDKALEVLTKACKLRTDSASIHNNLGIALERAGKHGEAKSEFEQALNIDSGKTHYFANHARMALSMGDTDEAMGDFVGIKSMSEKGAASSPEHAYPVLRQLDELIKLSPSDPANFYNRGIINFSQRNFADAERDFRKFLLLQNGSGESPTYGAILLSITLQNMGQRQRAADIISTARTEANTAWSKRLLSLYVGEDKIEDFMDAQQSRRRELAANCFIGLRRLAEGDKVSAEQRLKWVRDHALPSQDEYLLAISGLNKLDGKEKLKPRKEKRELKDIVSEAEISFK